MNNIIVKQTLKDFETTKRQIVWLAVKELANVCDRNMKYEPAGPVDPVAPRAPGAPGAPSDPRKPAGP